MDQLKQEVAILNQHDNTYDNDDDDATLWGIHKLRRELIDMFNRRSATDGLLNEEQFWMRWIIPHYRERDPRTGQFIVNDDHRLALLQSHNNSHITTTAEELDKVAALGMVKSILQTNFKAINGTECLENIREYANFRLGKDDKSRRGSPVNPWNVLADLFDEAQRNSDNDEAMTTEDIHQRVCNALVQWVVREIMGTTKNRISSRSCFHAIFLVSSLKLELQRLAPKSMALQEHGTARVEYLDSGDDAEGSKTAPAPSSSTVSHVRAPIVEKLLQSNFWGYDNTK